MSNFTAVFGKKCRISRNFLLFFEPPTPLIWNKAYLRYPMSLTVILLLIVMLTAGLDRLYRVARSYVQLYIARTDCILMDNGTVPAPPDPGLLRLQTVSWSYMSGWLGRDATNMLRAICETVHFVGSLIAQFVKFLCACLFPELGNWKFAQFPNWTNFVYKKNNFSPPADWVILTAQFVKWAPDSRVSSKI